MFRLYSAGLLFVATSLFAVEPPQLVVEATDRSVAAAVHIERLDRERLRIAMAYTGLTEPGPPVRVLIADEATALAKSVPKHIAGYAIPAQDIVVLFPARTTSYPDDGIEELLHHEIAHILIHRAGGDGVPRWLHEGLAMTIGGAWTIEDQARLGFDVMVAGETSLYAVDRDFSGSPPEMRRAYALAGAFVRELVQRHGAAGTARLLARLHEGRSIDTSFYMATGERLDLFEARFWKRQTLWHRWIPFITSTLVLWILITMLATWAIRRRRRRDALIREMWDLQEQRERLRESDGDDVVN